MKDIKMICKQEAINGQGKKIMNFTKGVIYEFSGSNDNGWKAIDDTGHINETFFNLNIMFEQPIKTN